MTVCIGVCVCDHLAANGKCDAQPTWKNNTEKSYSLHFPFLPDLSGVTSLAELCVHYDEVVSELKGFRWCSFVSSCRRIFRHRQSIQ